jgi:hypothetical protein
VSLHPQLLAEMLEDEVAVARTELGDRIADLAIAGSEVSCRLTDTNVGDAIIRLDGREYDGEPFKVAVVDSLGVLAERASWPGTLFHSVHPVLGRGFVCVRGTFEYHCYPSHLGDRWDTHRYTLRLPRLLNHLVRKAGR